MKTKKVLREHVKGVLNVTHDGKVASHFSFAEKLARLKSFQLKHKLRHVKIYCEGGTMCQQHKDSRIKGFGTPQALSFFSRRWGSIVTDFIIHLSKIDNAFHVLTSFVDRALHCVYFHSSKSNGTAIDCANVFLPNIFWYQGLLDAVLSDRDQCLPQSSGIISPLGVASVFVWRLVIMLKPKDHPN